MRLLEDEGGAKPVQLEIKTADHHSSDKTTVAYFKGIATDLGMPYQNLINLYLRDCAALHKKLELKWAS